MWNTRRDLIEAHLCHNYELYHVIALCVLTQLTLADAENANDNGKRTAWLINPAQIKLPKTTVSRILYFITCVSYNFDAALRHKFNPSYLLTTRGGDDIYESSVSNLFPSGWAVQILERKLEETLLNSQI